MAQHWGSLTGSFSQWNFTSSSRFFPSTNLANSNLDMKLFSADSGCVKKKKKSAVARKKTEAAVFNSAPSRVQLLHLSRSTELHQTLICLWQIGSRWAPGAADESLLAAAATTTSGLQACRMRFLEEPLMQLFVKNYCTLVHHWNGGRWSMTLSWRLSVCAEEQAPGEGAD